HQNIQFDWCALLLHTNTRNSAWIDTPPSVLWQHDDDPKHRVQVTKQWMKIRVAYRVFYRKSVEKVSSRLPLITSSWSADGCPSPSLGYFFFSVML
uniref:Uncharacterized protein n=1 Tax=Neolamprologus brichardi TaxID=32507 RepID=A0A3Q4I5X5_NEOBR